MKSSSASCCSTYLSSFPIIPKFNSYLRPKFINSNHIRLKAPKNIQTLISLSSIPASNYSMETEGTAKSQEESSSSMKLLFVEMGVGYDQYGQDITDAAIKACKNAITSNSIPAFRGGSIPGVTTDHMKLKIQLGVPRSTQQFLDVERVKSVFPYGKIISFEVKDGGMLCSSGVCLKAMGDENDDCYVVNAAVYVGY